MGSDFTFLDVINAWPSTGELARDIGEDPPTVRQWKYRRSIPPEHWRRVETAARKRGIEWVTIYVLTRAAEIRFSETTPPPQQAGCLAS